MKQVQIIELRTDLAEWESKEASWKSKQAEYTREMNEMRNKSRLLNNQMIESTLEAERSMQLLNDQLGAVQTELALSNAHVLHVKEDASLLEAEWATERQIRRIADLSALA